MLLGSASTETRKTLIDIEAVKYLNRKLEASPDCHQKPRPLDLPFLENVMSLTYGNTLKFRHRLARGEMWWHVRWNS